MNSNEQGSSTSTVTTEQFSQAVMLFAYPYLNLQAKIFSIDTYLLNDEKSKMMISSSTQKDFRAKQEGESNDGGKVVSKGQQPSSSRQWSGFRNPRIVRVSRTFGGKDRHSKVCTIRGLRDRRIRLSVPTAIQLYDLQDRLGLNQPSKVIDWLLDVTKDDIDKLPPLQFPQGFSQFHQPLLVSHESNPSQSSFLAPFFDPNSIVKKDLGGEDQCLALADQKRYWDNMDSATAAVAADKGKWIKVNELQENHQDGVGDSSQKLFPLTNHASLPAGLLNNSAMAFNSYYHWEPSNLSLSQFGNHGFLHQPESFFNGGNTSLPLPFFCPPSTIPSLFPTYPPYGTTAPGSDSRQMNNFQLLSSNSQHVEPNSFTMISSSPMKHLSLNVNAAGLSHTQNDDQSHAGEVHNTDS